MERCVAKAETDYSDAKYPTSAKILDIIRCACIYDNCDDLVTGMKEVARRIRKQDTDLKKVNFTVLICDPFCLSLHETNLLLFFVFVFFVHTT